MITVSTAKGDSPVGSYVFPAGGQRGKTVEVKVGGLNLHSKAHFEILGGGVSGPAEIRRGETRWIEGPLLPLPASQQAEDYPKDYPARISIAADAQMGPRAWRVWTSQGVSAAMPFVVGDLPEVIEEEVEGDPMAVPVTAPVTVNGRIFPREDLDLWSVHLQQGQSLSAIVEAARLGSPLDPWMEALGPDGQPVAGSTKGAGADARLTFLASETGVYTIKIHDVGGSGGQNYIYRLTLRQESLAARVFPLGGRSGDAVAFEYEGPDDAISRVSGLIPDLSVGSKKAPAIAITSFEGGRSALVDCDDLPESLEAGTEASAEFDIPRVLNGRLIEAGEVDAWNVGLKAGTAYQIELRAARLGSPLDGVLTIADPSGKELARAEGTPAFGGDPTLVYKPTADGRFLLKVADRYRSHHGTSHAYRLRIAEAGPPRLELDLAADSLTLLRKGHAKLKVEARRLGGFAGPIELKLEGLPKGVSVDPKGLKIAPNATAAELIFKAEADAPILSTTVKITGRGEVDGNVLEVTAVRRATISLPPIEEFRLAVGLPAPFKVVGPVDFGWSPRGSVRKRHYRLNRGGYDGPIEIRLADRQARHLQGVTGPILVVPPGIEEFDYSVTFPSWMEIGRTSRTVVVATAMLKDSDGTTHEVSSTELSADAQVVAVIGPGRLGLEARRSSFTVMPGASVEIPIKIARGKGVMEPVRIELGSSGGVQGIAIEPISFDGDRLEGTARLTFTTDAKAPPTGTVVLRAIADTADGPLIAEASLTAVAPPSPAAEAEGAR